MHLGVYSPKNLLKCLSYAFKRNSWHEHLLQNEVYPMYSADDTFTRNHYNEAIEFLRRKILPRHRRTTIDYTAKFWSCKGQKIQKEGEGIESYIFRIRKLQNKAGLDDSLKVLDHIQAVFLDGLRDKQVKNTAQLKASQCYPEICPLDELVDATCRAQLLFNDSKNNLQGKKTITPSTKTVNNINSGFMSKKQPHIYKHSVSFSDQDEIIDDNYDNHKLLFDELDEKSSGMTQEIMDYFIKPKNFDKLCRWREQNTNQEFHYHSKPKKGHNKSTSKKAKQFKHNKLNSESSSGEEKSLKVQETR